MTKNQTIMIIGVIFGAALVVFLGYGSQSGLINSCTAEYETYVKANYMESYLTTCYRTDSNGNSTVYPCHETRYWSVDASPIWVTRTVNGTSSTNSDETYKSNHGYFIHDIPPRNESLALSAHFRDFQNYRKTKLYISAIVNSEHTEFKKDPKFYKNCLIAKNSGMTATIKTWYGISYDAEVMM